MLHFLIKIVAQDEIHLSQELLVGNYQIESFPEMDDLDWRVELKDDNSGYQMSFFEGCSQIEMKFKWALKDSEIVFTESMERYRDSCDDPWTEWEKLNDNEEEADPFDIVERGNNYFIISSQLEEYQEKWIKQNGTFGD